MGGKIELFQCMVRVSGYMCSGVGVGLFWYFSWVVYVWYLVFVNYLQFWCFFVGDWFFECFFGGDWCYCYDFLGVLF